MKRLSIATIILLMSMSFSFAQAKKDSAEIKDAPEQVLIALERKWDEALVAEDIDMLGQLLADDFVISGTNVSKASYLELVKSPEFKYTSASKENIKVKVYENTAVVFAQHSISSEYGKNYARGATYSMMNVWVNRDGRWRVVATAADSLNIERDKAKQ